MLADGEPALLPARAGLENVIEARTARADAEAPQLRVPQDLTVLEPFKGLERDLLRKAGHGTPPDTGNQLATTF